VPLAVWNRRWREDGIYRNSRKENDNVRLKMSY